MNQSAPFLNSQRPPTSDAPEVFTPPNWYLEQALWTEDPSVSSNAAHNYALPMRIRGPLNELAFESSVQDIVRRHSVLRSLFQLSAGDNLVQVIPPFQAQHVPVWDLTGEPEPVREEAARRILLQDIHTSFDLRRGPMLRAGLLKLASEDHIVLLTTHHVVCDDWSAGILVRELFTLYSAIASEQRAPLAALPWQYYDFVKWLDTKLNGSEFESRVGFWRERLAGDNDFHHVPLDHLRPDVRTYRGAHRSTVLSEQLSNSLKRLSLQERVSLFMVMLAALQCLLHRYSSETDIGVGTCVANRPLPQLEGLVGSFANVTVLRTNLSGTLSFRDLFRRVRDVCLTSYSYQDLPFGTLLENLGRATDPARNPLFQVLFVLLNAPNEAFHAPGITIDPFPLDTQTTRYELNFWVKIRDAIEIDLQYNSELFEPATIDRILNDYHTILEAMVSNPEERISDLALTKQSKLPDQIGEPPRHAQASERPTAEIESKLAEIWATVLGRHPVGVDEDFFALGGDSLGAARIFAQIEKTFQRTVPLSILYEAPTIAKLSEVIRDMEAGGKSKCIVAIQPGNSRPPLFCIHGHSGSLLMYRILAQHLGSDQPVYGLQPRAFEGSEPSHQRIEDMASAYVDEIRSIQPQGPYFLTGYCMGGTVAFEMASQLVNTGQSVGLLALLDTYNWSRVKKRVWLSRLYLKAQLAWLSCKHFSSMSSRVKVQALKKRTSELWNTPTLNLIAESNSRIALEYIPGKYEGHVLQICPVHKDPRYANPQLGWEELAADGVEQFILPGYPWQLFEEKQVRQLASKLRTCIDEFTPSEKLKAA